MTKKIDLEESFLYDRHVLEYIHRASEHGLYDIRGLGAKRRVPNFDDLVFLTASASRYPLEGYREKCLTRTVLGARRAKKPVTLDIPITIAGMSFGSLSANVKEAIGRAASEVGTSTTTGDGGMTPEEAGILQDAGLPVPALPLRVQSPGPEAGRRHRDGDRPGGQARGGRHAAGAQGQPAGGPNADPARGHRPALGLPSPRLDRPRRPHHQDQRAARNHRLANPHLRQAGSHPGA